MRCVGACGYELSSSALSNYSSLGALSSSGKMAVRQVEFWLAVMVATVWRRTRTSKQSFSRPCPSRGVPEEDTDVCWQEGWVLFKVPRERLLDFWSHRTSQHSGSWLMSGFSESPGVWMQKQTSMFWFWKHSLCTIEQYAYLTVKSSTKMITSNTLFYSMCTFIVLTVYLPRKVGYLVI